MAIPSRIGSSQKKKQIEQQVKNSVYINCLVFGQSIINHFTITKKLSLPIRL